MDFSSLTMNFKFDVTPPTSIKLQQFLFDNDLAKWRIQGKIHSHTEAPYGISKQNLKAHIVIPEPFTIMLRHLIDRKESK